MTNLLVTYNVHGFVGIDRRYRPERCAKILQLVAPDVVALQEVVIPKQENVLHPLKFLASELDMNWVFAPTFETKKSYYGNALLSRLEIVSTHVHDLSYSGKEKRNLLEVNLIKEGKGLCALATHFGLGLKERHWQFNRVFQLLEKYKSPTHPLCLLGDLNQVSYKWTLQSKIRSIFPFMSRGPTFPSFSPFLSLDQIWLNDSRKNWQSRAYKSLLSRLASDHLPLLIETP